MNNLILFGFQSCGKSYFGKKLAQEIGFSFIDTDQWIEELFEKQKGQKKTCREIYREMGESVFRRIEHEVIFSLKEEMRTVIALGGGTLLNHNNLLILEKMGRLIYLELEKELLRTRLLSPPLPAFLDERNPALSFEKMYQERRAIYEKIDACRVCLTGKSDEEILHQCRVEIRESIEVKSGQ